MERAAAVVMGSASEDEDKELAFGKGRSRIVKRRGFCGTASIG